MIMHLLASDSAQAQGSCPRASHLNKTPSAPSRKKVPRFRAVMQSIMKLFALLLVITTPSIAVDPAEDPCQESGTCPDVCDQCGPHCHGEDVSAAKCDECIKEKNCEECKKCEVARGAAPPDAFVESE